MSALEFWEGAAAEFEPKAVKSIAYRIRSRSDAVKRVATLLVGGKDSAQVVLPLIRVLLLIHSC